MCEAEFCCDEGAVLAAMYSAERDGTFCNQEEALKTRIRNQRGEIRRLNNRIKELEQTIAEMAFIGKEDNDG